MKTYFNNSRFIFALLSNFHSRVEGKIRSFGRLERGWHFGEGIPAASQTIEDAIDLLNFGLRHGFVRSNAFPGLSGEVRVTFYTDTEYLEFTVESDRKITYVHETNRVEDDEQPELSLSEAKSVISESQTNLFTKKWFTSECYPSDIISIPKASPQGSLTWPSKTRMDQFQSSKTNVHKNAAVVLVRIFDDTISGKARTRLPSLEYLDPRFRLKQTLNQNRAKTVTSAT